ncbi:Carboxylesterase [Heracleum sosnowskyi]|uniref:Carboxylesterase n=1 Tax=Heracleum sosnowskyi TaxID=360622 RepID=A0AAD8GSE2_9APIA|nr:Carboxylesterase [Heracleum sosnowskyi]
MKKKIYPSTPPISDHLSLLPATILTLTVALSPEDRQVLAYLISCSANLNNLNGHHKTRAKTKVLDHAPEFECSCFGCYMSYWVRWNNSPNREVIHEIIDAYEDGLLKKKGGGSSSNGLKNKKGKRRGNYNISPGESEEKGILKESNQAELTFQGEEVGNLEKESSVKKIVSFLGGRIWNVWGI